eukprot:1160499-Rhodomonas_salina.1
MLSACATQVLVPKIGHGTTMPGTERGNGTAKVDAVLQEAKTQKMEAIAAVSSPRCSERKHDDTLSRLGARHSRSCRSFSVLGVPIREMLFPHQQPLSLIT